MSQTREGHIERHKLLHEYLDELIADWIACTPNLPSKATVYELMQWSAKQKTNPDKPIR